MRLMTNLGSENVLLSGEIWNLQRKLVTGSTVQRTCPDQDGVLIRSYPGNIRLNDGTPVTSAVLAGYQASKP